MAKTSLRNRLLLALVALLIFPILVVLAEIGVRLFASRVDPLSVFVTSPQLRSDTQGDATTGLFEFDPVLTWRLKPNLQGTWWDFTPVKTNSTHLRMEREIGTSAKPHLRILCLGDSVTFGYRVPVAPDRQEPTTYDPSEKPYPALLEELLRTRFPGKTIEVLPLACPGYTSGQGLTWLKRDVAQLQPDVITACFGFNDIRAAGLPDRTTFPTASSQIAIRRLMASSQLLLHLAKSAQSARASDLLPDHAEPRTSPTEYIDHFDQMQVAARTQGAWFGIILPIYRDPNTRGDYPEGKDLPGDAQEGQRMSLYRDHLRARAQQNQTPHLLIPELTEARWPDNAHLFGERIHPNAAGHRLMAERLVEFLLPAVEPRLR
jgi:lysophospholipase L1-like esterase